MWRWRMKRIRKPHVQLSDRVQNVVDLKCTEKNDATAKSDERPKVNSIRKEWKWNESNVCVCVDINNDRTIDVSTWTENKKNESNHQKTDEEKTLLFLLLPSIVDNGDDTSNSKSFPLSSDAVYVRARQNVFFSIFVFVWLESASCLLFRSCIYAWAVRCILRWKRQEKRHTNECLPWPCQHCQMMLTRRLCRVLEIRICLLPRKRTFSRVVS